MDFDDVILTDSDISFTVSNYDFWNHYSHREKKNISN
jgi:hypothetical protein